jgi:exosortase/archaeosortase family protein
VLDGYPRARGKVSRTVTAVLTASSRVAGWILPLALGGVLAALFLLQTWFRAGEATLASQFVAALAHTRTRAVPGQAVLYFGLGTPDALGLRITPECTSAFLIAPLVAVAAVMVRLRPGVRGRVLGALGIGTLLLILTNQLRITVVVWLVQWLGPDTGYYWGHTMLGSTVSVVGGAGSLAVFVWWAAVRTKPAGRHAA